MRGIVKRILSTGAAFVFAAVFLCVSFKDSEISAVQDTKLIALTFDDGPNLTTTQDILDTFELYGARGTFFLIGNNINDATAQSVKRAHDMGCEIANHSKSHTYMTEMSESEIQDEINYTDDWVYKITGEHTKFFRAPFLNTNDKMYDVIDQTFICGVNCEDCSTEPQGRADAIMNAAKDGLIVLMHDGAGNTPTSEALKIAIPELQKQGYEFVTLSELFERQGETPLGDRTYSEVTKYPCDSYVTYKNIFTGEASGENSWSGWGELTVIDKSILKELGDKFAVEVSYDSKSAPVLVLQKWTGDWLYQALPPAYSNGSKACFMADQVIQTLDELGLGYDDLDKINIAPYGTSMKITKIDILQKADPGAIGTYITGDVNADGSLTAADILMMRNWLLGTGQISDSKAADFDINGQINIFDFIMLRRLLITMS